MGTRPLVIPEAGQFDVDLRADGDVMVVKVAGDIDQAVAGHLRQSIESAAEQSPRVVVDMQYVPFMDSMGLRVFAEFASRLREAGGALALMNVQPGPMMVLRISGMAGAIRVVPI